MPKTLIIGNSPAATSAIEEIRRTDASSEIALLCPEQVLPYDHTLLSGLVNKDIKEPALFASDKFFKQHNVQLLADEVLTRVSTKRKQVSTESRKHFAFDKLLLTDAPTLKLPAVKGHHKKGFFHVLNLNSVKEMIKYLPFVDTIVVSATTLAGFDMACALKRIGKEVVLLSAGPGLLEDIFDEETSGLLKQVVEAQGMRVIIDPLEEALGDAEIKAVRLKSGKVLAAEMVVVDQCHADLKFLSETGLLEGDHLQVDEFFKTTSDDIYACGRILGQLDLFSAQAEAQGRYAAANLLNPQSRRCETPVSVREFGAKICDGFCGGSLHLRDGGRERMEFDGPKNVYKKIYLLNDCLTGAVWFNAMEDKTRVQEALAQNLSLAGTEEQFLHAHTNLPH